MTILLLLISIAFLGGAIFVLYGVVKMLTKKPKEEETKKEN